MILYNFCFLITVNLFSSTCLLQIGFFELFRSTVLSLVSFDSSLVFVMVERLQSGCLRIWTDVFYIEPVLTSDIGTDDQWRTEELL